MDAPFFGFSDILRGGVDNDGRQVDHTPKSVLCWMGGALVLLWVFHNQAGFRVVIGAGRT